LNPSSKIKGEKDYEKFETARRLKGFVEDIRKQYTADFKAHEMRVRQRAVALYFIDKVSFRATIKCHENALKATSIKLALRAGNEKDTQEGREYLPVHAASRNIALI